MFRKTLALFLLFALVLAQGEDDFIDDVEDAAEDVADFADEETDAASDEIEAAADAVVADLTEEVKEEKSLDEQMAEENFWVLLIGVSACADTLWWFLFGWFIYVQTNAQDSTMCVNSDCVVQIVPIAWFWNSLSHTTLGWTALTYFWIWLFYMLISVPELIFWIWHMVTEDQSSIGHWLFNMWASYPGLYGSWIFYFFTVLFPLIQLTSFTGINQPGYTNAALQFVMMMFAWLYTGIVHVLGFPYVNRKFARWNHFPSVLPGASEEEEALDYLTNAADDAAAETVEAVDEAEDSLDDATDAAEDAVEEVEGDSADW